jgi:hypothetical protein
MDAFSIVLVAIIMAVVLFIVRAVRLTRGQIDQRLCRTDPRRRDDVMRDLATHIREQADRVRCTQCGGPTFMVLGTDDQYKCEVCHVAFDGPRHMAEG